MSKYMTFEEVRDEEQRLANIAKTADHLAEDLHRELCGLVQTPESAAILNVRINEYLEKAKAARDQALKVRQDYISQWNAANPHLAPRP